MFKKALKKLSVTRASFRKTKSGKVINVRNHTNKINRKPRKK